MTPDDRSLTPAPFHKLEGHAATLAERQTICEAIFQAWNAAPDLRLGQLLLVATSGKNLWLEDDLSVLALLAEFKDRVAK